MISRKELENYARLRGMNNIGNTEKDYFQNILLFILSQNYGNNLIFKGGTALSKCFGLDRFSEDLDFTCEEKINIQTFEEELKRFKIEFDIEKKEFGENLSLIVRINGPLYNGNKNSRCKVILDLSLREKVLLKPEIKTIGRFLEEIPSFDVLVMQEKEIFAEKIRAIMTREKARDVYDLWYLVEKGILFDKKLADEKLKYYSKSFNKKEFIAKLSEKKSIWDSELKLLVKKVPDFAQVKKNVLSVL